MHLALMVLMVIASGGARAALAAGAASRTAFVASGASIFGVQGPALIRQRSQRGPERIGLVGRPLNAGRAGVPSRAMHSSRTLKAQSGMSSANKVGNALVAQCALARRGQILVPPPCMSCVLPAHDMNFPLPPSRRSLSWRGSLRLNLTFRHFPADSSRGNSSSAPRRCTRKTSSLSSSRTSRCPLAPHALPAHVRPRQTCLAGALSQNQALRPSLPAAPPYRQVQPP